MRHRCECVPLPSCRSPPDRHVCCTPLLQSRMLRQRREQKRLMAALGSLGCCLLCVVQRDMPPSDTPRATAPPVDLLFVVGRFGQSMTQEGQRAFQERFPASQATSGWAIRVGPFIWWTMGIGSCFSVSCGHIERVEPILDISFSEVCSLRFVEGPRLMPSPVFQWQGLWDRELRQHAFIGSLTSLRHALCQPRIPQPKP